GDLGEDLLLAHDPKKLGFADPRRPLLTQLRALLAQVRHQLLKRRLSLTGSGSGVMRPRRIALHVPRSFPTRRRPAITSGGEVIPIRFHVDLLRAPSRNKLVIASTLSSTPADDDAPSTLTITPISASTSHATGMSSRISSSDLPRSIRARR